MKDNGGLVNGPKGVFRYSADLNISTSRNWVTPQAQFTHSWAVQLRCLQACPRSCSYRVMEKWIPLLSFRDSIAFVWRRSVLFSEFILAKEHQPSLFLTVVFLSGIEIIFFLVGAVFWFHVRTVLPMRRLEWHKKLGGDTARTAGSNWPK